MQLETAVKAHAFEGAIAEMTPEHIYIAVEDKRERYFFYPGDEPGRKHPGGLSVNTPCVPYRVIRRCQVTPCVSRQVPARTEEIAEGARIPGTIDFAETVPSRDNRGQVYYRTYQRLGFAKYWLPSGPEADGLLAGYGNPADSSRNWGLIELLPDKLRGMSYADYAKLHINEAVFPQWPDIPETNRGVIDHLLEMQEQIKRNEHPWFRWDKNKSETILHRDIYLACIPQMVEAAEAAQAFQAEVIRNSNIAATLPKTEIGYKSGFDDRDRLYSKRAGIPLAADSLREGGAVEAAAERLAGKLRQQVAPQMDPSQFGMMAVAIVRALRDEGMLAAPAEEAGQKPSKKNADRN